MFFENPFCNNCTFLIKKLRTINLNVFQEEKKLSESFGSHKRKIEFLNGRDLYHQAIKNLMSTQTPLLKKKDGQPDWPSGIIGSLSHSDNYIALALCKKKDPYLSIGLDLQKVKEIKFNPNISRHILSSDEALRFKKELIDDPLLLLYIFSAKEAFYKALFPITNKYLGFKEVEIIRIGASSFTMHLLQEESKTFFSKKNFQVSFAKNKQLVLTASSIFPKDHNSSLKNKR